MNTNNANPADEVMCLCSGTTRGEIQHLCGQGLDLIGISRRTGALSGCGGCEWDMIQLLKACREQQRPGA